MTSTKILHILITAACFLSMGTAFATDCISTSAETEVALVNMGALARNADPTEYAKKELNKYILEGQAILRSKTRVNERLAEIKEGLKSEGASSDIIDSHTIRTLTEDCKKNIKEVQKVLKELN